MSNPTIPPQEESVFSVSELDDVRSMELMSVAELVLSVQDPTSQIIDNTFTTGHNTSLLISLCGRARALIKDGYDEVSNSARAVNAATVDITAIHEILSHDPKHLEHPEYNALLAHISRLERLKSLLVVRVPIQLNEVDAFFKTMAKILEGLLADQKEHGCDIKTGTTAKRYTITCGVVNGHWAKLRGGLLSLIEIYRRMEMVGDLRAETRSMFVHSSRNGELVLGEDFRDLDTTIQALVVIEERDGQGNSENK